MNEREIFQSAIEITDDTERQEYLDSACGSDGALRQQVEQLLRAHADASQFLAIPAAAQLSPPADDPTEVTTFLPSDSPTPDADSPTEDDAVSLAFLEPSTKPGSRGRLAHYEVLEILGCGAFGTVLKAFDEKLHRMVAIKVLNSELAATSPPRKRFLREAQSSARIRHENIVSIYAVEEQPLPYLVMEYIPGGTLQQRLDQTGPLNVEEILRLGQQIALGLSAAHAQGLIHRDIKPANILIGAGVEERVKITDFGLARATDDASLTQSGLIAGTPMYMSPEQAKGQTLDHRTDLFSLGSVLYTMASGRPPFRAPNTIAVLKRVCEDIPRPIREVIPETPSWLSDIISKLHAKDPDDRFQSAKEVAEVMGQHLAFVREPMKAPRPAPIVLPAELETVMTPKLRRPEKTPGWSPAAILLTVIAGLLVLPVVGIVLLIIGLAIPAYQAAGSRVTITPETGTLIVQSDEPFITAVVDNRRMPLPGREEIELTLPAGPHVVTFWKEGQRLGTKTIQVAAGQNHVARWPDQPGTVLVDVSNSAWQSLFNGRDFTGWQPNSHWKIENGCMVSRVSQNAGLTPAMLVTERADLRDFHVQIEAKINNGGDSGLFFRFGEQGDKALQAQITAAPTAIGSLLREVTTIAPSTMIVRPDTWFTLEVIALGPHITVLVDGVGVVRWADPTGEIPTGPLAFESGFPGTELMIRKVALKSPATAGSDADFAWQSLFNGRDLTGWMTHPQQPGNWRVEEGTIVGAGSVSHLFTTRDDFRDFEFRGEVRLSQDGNSGVFIRTPFAMTDPNSAVSSPPGYEVQLVEGNQVHPAQSYLSGGVIPLANPNGANLIQQGQWYKFRVKADGDKFETWIDDVQTVSAIDPQRKYQGGHLALQVWSAKSKVEFRNLEVRSLSSSAKMPVEFNGTWDSVWGPVTLTHAPPNGDQPVELTGTYTLNGPASIRGTLDPKTRTFRGRFIQTAQEGRLQLTLSEDGKSIIGWYDYLLNESFEKTQPRSSWNLSRQLPRIDFNGEWDSRWGVVTFQHGPISAPLPGPVHGTYYNGAGTIEGTVDPVTRQFIGIFHETSGMSGRIELKLSENNAAISGIYYYAKNPNQKYEWLMTRKGAPSAMSTSPSTKRRFASEEWIDVLPVIDPQLDKWDVPQRTGMNAWSIENGELLIARDPMASTLLIPLDSDWSAFECELELTRRAGDSGLNVNIPAQVGDCPLVFEPPTKDGVFLGEPAKGASLNPDFKFVTGQKAALQITVRPKNGVEHVSVSADATLLGEWRGDRKAIAYTQSENYPRRRRLSLWIHGGGNEFVFHRIRVRMLDGGTAETLRPVPTLDVQAARAVVVEKELFRDQVQQRFDAGTASALELIDTEIDLSEATAHLNRVEGKAMGVLTALTNLVSLREREHAMIAEQVTAGVRINTDLLQADARLRDVRGRLDSALASTPAVVPFDAAQAKIFQSAWAKHLDVPVEYTNAMGMKFRLIPPGTFLMGATEDEIRQLSRDLEQANASDFDKFVARFAGPQHWVKITQPYYLASQEVTVGQYREFIEASRHIPTMEQLGVKRFHWQDCAIEPNPRQRAVIGVSWDDASAFCRWASKKHGLKYDLPTEAQWEYACRAGTTTLWSFGNDVAELAEYAVIGRDSFWPAEVVGTKKPNPFELWDMHGNADEWCLDWHDSEFYRTGPPNDPVCLANPKDKNSGRVARGGTSHSTPWWTRSATRPWDFPATPNNPKGFRPTLTVETVKVAIQAVAATIPEPEWQPLFNGKDLVGWKPHPDDPGEWHVENGVLIGSGKPGYLFSERDDFTDFHLRAEVQINDGGDSGIIIRSPFLKPDQDGLPGYEAQIQAGKVLVKGWASGALGGSFPKTGWQLLVPAEVQSAPEERFLLEIIARGNQIETRINGEKVVSNTDTDRNFIRGHLALQQSGPTTNVRFHKIEVRQLKP